MAEKEYIEREALCYQLEKQATIDGQPRAIKRATKIVANFPAADVVERKTGKWIDYTEDSFVECPFCHSATNCDGEISELHYCFNCGAQMIGGDEDA